jgi:hypothetical protein
MSSKKFFLSLLLQGGEPWLSYCKLKRSIQSGFKLIRGEAPSKEKYEVAYGNWIWGVENIFLFVRRQMREDGLKKFERADVETSIKKNATPALIL